ncbi:MAG: hypothetical protein ACTHMC_28210 [Pseudobacter sp.]|uniref:hypothetical protein n=1 Tax=Pseudobacter sp. TaxID=2045420 RepID=UPI003F7E28D8
MNIRFTFYTLLISSASAMAQDKRIQVSLGSGITGASSAQKNNQTGNGYNFQADVFVPFYANRNGIILGLTASGNYSRLKNNAPDNGDAASKYKVYNTDISINSQTSKSMSNSISGLLGLQAQFNFGNFHLSPAISAGYLNFAKEGFVQNGFVSVNGQQHQKVLVSREREVFEGLVLSPQLRAGYKLTSSFSLFASAAINRGQELDHTTSYLQPEGGMKENNTYEISQLANGSYTNSQQTIRYNTTDFNIGLTFSLGRNKKTKKEPVKQPGAASASYAATGKLVQSETGEGAAPEPGQAARKSISSKGVKRSEGPALARPGQPIGGIVVKGGKNPGGNIFNLISDTDGKISFDIQESGSYILRLNTPEQPAGKSINEKGVKRNENAIAKPGNPIGGIIVKGGKNPGGSFISVISNSNGEVLLSNLEPGNYQFILQQPETPAEPNKKGRKEKKEKGSSAPGLKDVIKTQV